MNVLTLGTFDLFHRGHVQLLERAARFGPVIVGLNSDRFVSQYKGRPPIMAYPERLAVVEACRYVNDVQVNDGPGRVLIEDRKPDLVVIGSDWLDQGYMAQLDIDQAFLVKRGISVLFVPYTQGISTTMVKERLEAETGGDRHVLPAPRSLSHASPAAPYGLHPAA